jgi:hypothetical protein
MRRFSPPEHFDFPSGLRVNRQLINYCEMTISERQQVRSGVEKKPIALHAILSPGNTASADSVVRPSAFRDN